MYLQFFGLNEAPFSITPDPAFVYLSAVHRDALAHLLYGVGQGGASGFVQLTGEVGTGKTTLCRCLLEQVPDDTRVALVLNPLMTPGELLATICEELGIDVDGKLGSNKALVDTLNEYLLEQHAEGTRVVVVIDEAQNLSPEALEQVRLLTNLETSKNKLLQMVLLGQPELRELLQRQNLRQLSQRITARYHLVPLNQEETFAYVKHRMKVAGAQRNPFRRTAMRALYQRSCGVPRLINIIADRALVGAYARETDTVNSRLVHAAANEVQPSEKRVSRRVWPAAVATACLAILVGVSLLIWNPFGLEGLAPSPGDGPAASAVQLETTNPPAVEAETAAVPVALNEAPVGSIVEESPPTSEEQGLLSVPGWLEEQHRRAWRSMAELWQDPSNAHAIQSACDGVNGTGYACLSDHGNWSRIRQLGLPVILVLQKAETRLLVLNGFTPDKLLVGSTDELREISRDEVERYWFGEYIVTWPQAPDWPGEIRRGESGAAVDIVMQLAGSAEPAWQGGSDFDAGFETWLMTFQRRHGLEPDGIIGPNTLIYLMAPTISKPRLILNEEERS